MAKKVIHGRKSKGVIVMETGFSNQDILKMCVGSGDDMTTIYLEPEMALKLGKALLKAVPKNYPMKY